MQIFTKTFMAEVKKQLNALDGKQTISREKVCEALGLDSKYVPAIALMQHTGCLTGFESVKGRNGGIRKVAKVSTPVTTELVVPDSVPQLVETTQQTTENTVSA